MKTISSALATHLTLDCTTLATLWKVKRTDGVIMGFTDHDQNIIYDDGSGDTGPSGGPTTYYASTGMTPTATETGSDLGVDNLEITAFLDSSAITDADIRAGRYNYADISVYLVNFNDLTMGDLRLRRGTLGQVTMVNGLFQAEIRGLSFFLSCILGLTFGPICRADLGDAQCTVNLGPFTQTGAVSTVSDNRTFVPVGGPSGISAAPNYFNDGVLTWLTGLNAGFLIEVDIWDGTQLFLFESMPFNIQPGDTFTVEAGCNKTTDCQAKFNNIINKRSEDFIPGQDQILAYGTQ